MEKPGRHRECDRDDNKNTRLLLPWSDNLMSWDGVDYRPAENSPSWRTPSMTSGSSRPSTLNITLESETTRDHTQEGNIDPSIAHIASGAESESGSTETSSSERLRSNSDDFFLEHAAGCGDSSSGTSGYTGSGSYHSDYEDGESVSDDEAESSEEDNSRTMIISRISPRDSPPAPYSIPIAGRDSNYSFTSHTNYTENVAPLHEDIKTDGGNLESSAASANSNTQHEKRYRKAEEPGEDEDEDDGGDDDDKRKPKRMKGNDEVDRAEPITRLACPFHKKDPNKYNVQFDEAGDDTSDKNKKTEYRPCAGPGFKNIQRLKEHLKRKHYPVQCDRCYRIFSGSRPTAISELERHRQLSTPCERKDSSLKEGISDAQWAQLDKKPSSKDSASSTVVEKWNHIWGVLFPDTPLPATPWYDYPSRELTLPNEESRSFLELFKGMLDEQVGHQDIKFTEDAEDVMKARVVTLVGKAFATYSASNENSSTNSTSTRSLKHTYTSGSAIQPVFSVTNSRLNRASAMSSTSAPSSAISMDSPESVEGINHSPTILNVSNTFGGLQGQAVLVESPIPSSDLDIVPGIKRVFTGREVVVNRNQANEGPRSGDGNDAAQNQSR